MQAKVKLLALLEMVDCLPNPSDWEKLMPEMELSIQTLDKFWTIQRFAVLLDTQEITSQIRRELLQKARPTGFDQVDEWLNELKSKSSPPFG